MITGAHVLIYSPAADEVRQFIADVLGFPGTEAGGGWPIFAMPPAASSWAPGTCSPC